MYYARVYATLTLILFIWIPATWAQEKITLLIGTEANANRAQDRFETLPLRPNIELPLYLFLRNDEIIDEKLALKIFCRSNDGEVLLKQLDDITLKSKNIQEILIKLEKPVQVPNGNELIFSVLDKNDKDKEILRKSVKFKIMKPEEYLKFTPELDKNGNLKVDIKRENNFRGPECKLELDCSALRNLLPGQEFAGSLLDSINATDKETAVLALQQLKFKKNAVDDGFISIKVDGVPRAKVYVTNMVPGTGLKSLPDRNVIRFNGPTYWKPDPENKYKARIEVDNLEVEDAKINVYFDRANIGSMNLLRSYPSTRQIDVAFSSSDKGVFSIKPIVQDWPLEIVSEGLNGERKFEAELVKKDDSPLGERAKWTVVFSKERPKNIRISLNESKQKFQLGEKVLATATAESPTGISKAFFFLGDVAPKEPEKLIPATESDKSNSWQANVTLPDQKGRAKLGVVMENGVGLTSTHIMDVLIEDPAMSSSKEKLATIKGNVVQGDRPQRGLTVALFDDKKMPVKTTRTDDSGNFTFTDLNAGSYILVCQREDNAQAREVVTVEKGGEKTVTLSLER